jgi:hypothetical protein
LALVIKTPGFAQPIDDTPCRLDAFRLRIARSRPSGAPALKA